MSSSALEICNSDVSALSLRELLELCKDDEGMQWA